MNRILERTFCALLSALQKASNTAKVRQYRKTYNIHPTARLHYPENTWFKGNIIVGPHSYINGGRFVSGPDTKIQIGQWCAIGHNVNMIGWTHDTEIATGDMDKRPSVQKDIIIGDFVWIGSNVFIREGVTIGNHAIIGANSVVTKDIPDYAIAGGIPAKVIRFKKGKPSPEQANQE